MDCRNCEDHELMEKAINEMPAIKTHLANVEKGVFEIMNFLNGGLDKKGFITTLDERLWQLEQWKKTIETETDTRKQENMDDRKELKSFKFSIIAMFLGNLLVFGLSIIAHLLKWM